MYTCSNCQTEAKITESVVVRTCECENATIVAGMEATAHGQGGLNVETTTNHNLSKNSAIIIESAMTAILAVEFFNEGKKELHANGIKITDNDTKRKFEFTLTAKEIF